MENKRYSKPEGFEGRGKGSTNYKTFKWDIIFFDKEKNEMRTGKFPTIRALNEALGLNLTTDIVWRLTTLNKVDTSRRNKENSFLARFAHIKLTKINIPVVKDY